MAFFPSLRLNFSIRLNSLRALFRFGVGRLAKYTITFLPRLMLRRISSSVPESATPVGEPNRALKIPTTMSPFGHTAPPPACKVCGGGGLRLDPADDICTDCGWLRPLFPGYELDRTVFLWAQDGQAMNTLHNMSVLNAVARTVSDKVGRPWIEATYNGIRIGPNQLPHVWKLAVLAARLLGVPYMPDVYVSGDSMWNTYTFGSDKVGRPWIEAT